MCLSSGCVCDWCSCQGEIWSNRSHPDKSTSHTNKLTISTYSHTLYKQSTNTNQRNPIYRVFNLKVDRKLSREFFTSDAIYNGSAGMILYYYMCRSWQDCCRGEENRFWPFVSVESVDNECWCLNNAIFYAFIMRLTVEERVFILESYLKTMFYAHCKKSFFEKFRRQAPVNSVIAKND